MQFPFELAETFKKENVTFISLSDLPDLDKKRKNEVMSSIGDAQSEAVLNSRPAGKRTTIFTIKDLSFSLCKAQTEGLTEIPPNSEKNELRDTIAKENVGVLRRILLQAGICASNTEAIKVPAKTTRNEDADSSIKIKGATDVLYDHICNKYNEVTEQQEYLTTLFTATSSSSECNK